MEIYNNPDLMRRLQKDIPILTAQIRSLYTELDKKFRLNGAKVPITFGFDKDLLGSYTQAGISETKESYRTVSDWRESKAPEIWRRKN